MQKRKNILVITIIILALLIALATIPAYADDGKLIDWSQYDLDQLMQIQDELAEEIYARKVAFAKENGDRIIDLGEESIDLFVGKTYAPEISIERVLDESPETTKLLWSSEDDSIAKVDASGKISGVAEGKTVVTCHAEDDEFIQASIEVNVVLPVTKVMVTDSVTLLIAEDDKAPVKEKLEAQVEPDDAFDPSLTWTSDNEAVATVDEKGVVTAVGPGTATITATADDGFSDRPNKASCKVTVLKSVSSIELGVKELVLDKNGNQKLEYTVLPEDATKKDVTWESSDPDIVTVNAYGQVSARACGKATITCRSTDGTDVYSEIVITVVQKVTSLRWKDNTPITMNVGKSFFPEVEIGPEDATNKSLKWESSDTAIFSVSSSGEIKAIRPGTATVTCTAADGSEKTISREIFIPSISFDKTEYTVSSKKGLTINFMYYGKSDDIEWTMNETYCDGIMHRSGTDGRWSGRIELSPKKAGTFTITVRDKSSPRSTVSIKVTVDHSAAYDTVSYPRGDYSSILRSPSSYKGDQISIYGKVLQKQSSWGTTVLRVGTGGYGCYDSVFYVTYSDSDIDINVIEDDYITIYGTCTGTKTYTTVLGGSITIPSLEAEKIILGRN